MKHFIVTLALISTFISSLHGQWDVLNEGVGFNMIKFATDSVGWIAGGDKILKTEDGRDTWLEIILNDGINIHQVDFLNESVGWAITRNNYDPAGFYRDTYFILKTEDGGSTWIIQKELPATYLEELQAVDDSTVYISAFTGSWDNPIPKFLKTVDGGDNWIEIPRNENHRKYQSIWFQDADNGIIVGTEYESTNPVKSIILRTNDGGAAFDETLIPNIEISDFQIMNDSTAYFLGGSFICVTNDTLNSWTQLTYNNMNIQSFFILDDTTIFAIMHDNLTSICFMKSKDAGLTWEEKCSLHWLAPVFFWECDIYFRNKDIGYIVSRSLGGTNYLLQTFDSGNEWEIQNFDIYLENIFFIDRYKGFIYGCIAGSIFPGPSTDGMFVSINGGSTWKYFTNRPPGSIERCIFINELVGIALSYEYYDGLEVYKTIDGGQTWNGVFANYQNPFGFGIAADDIGFIDENNIYIVGNYSTNDSSGALILGTDDGGLNWDLAWQYPNTTSTGYDLGSIHIIGTKVWAVGNDGLVVSSVKPDSFTVVSGVTSLDLKDVFFSDSQHGWIIGENSSLFKTINSGQTWIEKQFDEYFIFDMYFADSLHGWAVGSDTIFYTGAPALESGNGVILNTIDGGENWTVQVKDLSAPINAIHFKDGYGWAVGGNGLVLRTEDGSTWIDERKSGKTYPQEYKLFQNYPNPFNPKTVISYQLPFTSQVELSIYNILGQKVKTLVSEKQPAGTYRVEWNAAGFASGVYFIKLAADKGFSETKKMVYIR